MPSLFELNEQAHQIDMLLDSSTDSETGEILSEARAVLEQDIENKVNGILEYMANCQTLADGCKKEIDRLNGRIKTLNSRCEFLKGLLKAHLESNGITKKEYGTHLLSIAKTPAKVVLTDDALEWLPDDLCSITKTANKTAIKNAMTDGVYKITVDGNDITLATLETGTTIRIK